ncbi:MAG: type I polyketide synthase, partial [Gammaproteobacteria bacterium]|nr:type I polyketide synthase [Gammaproteobacteria bacterium]
MSSFGIGGTNAHAVLEEAPEVAASAASKRSWQVLPVSAKSEAALTASCAQLADYLEARPELVLADLAYTLQLGREAHGWRRALFCRDGAEAVSALRSVEQGVRAAQQGPAVVFLYPGQGTQYPNMGVQLYREEAVYREAVDGCCDQLRAALGLDLRGLLYPMAGEEALAAEQLRRTALTQPALFVTEYALTCLLAEWGIRPVAMLGHSIGELVAACVSGVLERDAALALVAARGRLMEAAPSGVMLSLVASAEEARDYEGEGVWLSVVNGPRASVLSCTHEALAQLESRLSEAGVAYQRLQTSHAFHCGLMDGVTDALREVAGGLRAGPVGVPYVSNVSGDWMGEEVADPGYWSRQVRGAVKFAAGVEQVLSRHADCVLLEVGPGQALSQLVRGVSKGRALGVVRTLGGAKEAGDAGQWLARALGELWCTGVAVDWSHALRGERRLKVELPGYPFQRKRYWVEPGRRT